MTIKCSRNPDTSRKNDATCPFFCNSEFVPAGTTSLPRRHLRKCLGIVNKKCEQIIKCERIHTCLSLRINTIEHLVYINRSIRQYLQNTFENIAEGDRERYLSGISSHCAWRDAACVSLSYVAWRPRRRHRLQILRYRRSRRYRYRRRCRYRRLLQNNTLSMTNLLRWKTSYVNSDDGLRKLFRIHVGIDGEIPFSNIDVLYNTHFYLYTMLNKIW